MSEDKGVLPMEKKRLKKSNWPFYAALVLDFYLLPALIVDTGSAMVLMLLVMPAVCLITSVIYGMKNGFCYWYGIAAVVLFVPSIFLFYNESAWVYSVLYGVIALLGNLLPVPFGKKSKQ